MKITSISLMIVRIRYITKLTPLKHKLHLVVYILMVVMELFFHSLRMEIRLLVYHLKRNNHPI